MSEYVVFKKQINDHDYIYGERRLADYLNTTVSEVNRLILAGIIEPEKYGHSRFNRFKKLLIDSKLKGKAKYIKKK